MTKAEKRIFNNTKYLFKRTRIFIGIIRKQNFEFEFRNNFLNHFSDCYIYAYAIKNIILPLVLYGSETWFLTLKEEYRLRVFENRVTRTIFGPKRDVLTGDWRKLHSEELHDVYSSPSIFSLTK